MQNIKGNLVKVWLCFLGCGICEFQRKINKATLICDLDGHRCGMCRPQMMRENRLNVSERRT